MFRLVFLWITYFFLVIGAVRISMWFFISWIFPETLNPGEKIIMRSLTWWQKKLYFSSPLTMVICHPTSDREAITSDDNMNHQNCNVLPSWKYGVIERSWQFCVYVTFLGWWFPRDPKSKVGKVTSNDRGIKLGHGLIKRSNWAVIKTLGWHSVKSCLVQKRDPYIGLL